MTFERREKEENELIEDWLLFFDVKLSAYQKTRDEIIYSTKPADQNGGGGSGPGDPTGRVAAQLAELQLTEKWIKLIQDVEKKLPRKMRVFLRLRRKYSHIRRGPEGWVPKVQRDYASEMARLLGKRPEDVWIESRTTFASWWKKIVEFTARQAAKAGLLEDEQ